MEAELHFFHSGNGDTILVRGGDQWGLVDANFVKSRGVRTRVQAKLEGVERLRFVCITHFDLDHIRGLVNFLKDRFSMLEPFGRRIWHIDQIICPVFPTTIETIATLKARVCTSDARRLFPELEERAFEMSEECNLLLDMLCEIAIDHLKYGAGTGTPEIVTLSVGLTLFGPPQRPDETRFGPWSLVSLGPSERTTQRYSQQVMNGFLNSEALRGIFKDENTNATSRIMALRHDDSGEVVLLTGDSTPPELRLALEELRKLNNHHGVPHRRFRCVKVSHHGAETCHVEEIYEYLCDTRDSVAVFCAADDGSHPHPEVKLHISQFVKECWITGKGKVYEAKPVRRRGMPLGYRRSVENYEDIQLQF